MKLTTEVKIGIIVTIAIVFTIWGLNYLKGRNILTSVHQYKAYYDEIAGMEENAKIFMRGYQIGNVSSIRFDPGSKDRLEVKLAIEKEYRIPRNSVAVLNVDLLGTPAIRISRSDSREMHEPGDTLISEIEVGLADRLQEQFLPVTEKAESVFIKIDSLVEAVNYVLDPDSRANLRKAIEDLRSSSESLDLMLRQNSDLNQMIANLEEITEKINENKDQLAAAIENFNNISDSIAKSELKSTINNANKTLAATHLLIDEINQGKGTLGLLATNDSLYRNLETLTHDLDDLIKDLQENPKKYVHFSIFGRKKKENQ